MTLVEELYENECSQKANHEVWMKTPFRMFSPDVRFLGFSNIARAIKHQDQTFFINNIRNNFFPDKNDEDSIEGKRNAINRGIKTLNDLCERFIPEYSAHFLIPELDEPLDPLKLMTEAREKWLSARNGKHKPDPQLMFEAYNAVRSWGLGHFVLIIDTDPAVFHSVRESGMINTWFEDTFDFQLAKQMKHRDKNGNSIWHWENKSGVDVYGEDPFRKRAKIYDERGNVKYASILQKMFRKQGFLDRINDTYGVEFVVENDEDVEKLLDHFRREVRGASSLEKFQHVKDQDPPFECYKFILRVPIRIKPTYQDQPETLEPVTIHRPLEKYIRLPVEVQVRKMQEIDHETFKKREFMEVFPLWYPRAIYEPLLKEAQ